jgi:hypothetical protein
MSSLIPPIPTAISVFRARFGAPPDGQDANADCEKWERLCSELLAERARLRAKLEKARVDQICKDFRPEFTMEEI